jgi:hypothetical protein
LALGSGIGYVNGTYRKIEISDEMIFVIYVNQKDVRSQNMAAGRKRS